MVLCLIWSLFSVILFFRESVKYIFEKDDGLVCL